MMHEIYVGPSIFDGDRSSFNAKDGVYKVGKGVLVLMTSTRVGNNLYKLMGNTIIGGATVSTKDKNQRR